MVHWEGKEAKADQLRRQGKKKIKRVSVLSMAVGLSSGGVGGVADGVGGFLVGE